MSTIYTLNSKVLKNTANDKWLIKKVVPTDEVQIGDQIWKSKNLAIDDGQGGIYTQTVNYGQGDVVEYYYTWDAAVRVAASIPGWHIPTQAEWETLAAAVGGTSIAGTKLKSTYGWGYNGNGTDDFGIAVFPAGYWYNSSFCSYHEAYFWTTDEESSRKAYCYYFRNSEPVYTTSNLKTSFSYSIRLIKD
jgi:uncharacterized protein (TIGR02145 family)